MDDLLQRGWFSEPTYDFELKKYQFLAYAQRFESALQHHCFYPWRTHLSAMIGDMQHYRHLKSDADLLRRGALSGIDMENRTLLYSEHPDQQALVEVNRLVDFALPQLQTFRETVEFSYRQFKGDLSWQSVGVTPTYLKRGLTLIQHTSGLHLYTYEVPAIYYERKVTLTHVRSITSAILNTTALRRETEYNGPVWIFSGGEEKPLVHALEPAVAEIVYELVS